MPDGRPWPLVTVVTPTLNRGRFLEETLRSVLLQGYPNLEYVVQDGLSSDGSVEILRRYESWLQWESAPDRGQADALRRGFQRAAGSLIAWINADDMLLPGAIAEAATQHAADPDAVVVGAVWHHDEASGFEELIQPYGLSLEGLVGYWAGRSRFQQPGSFFPRRIYEACGGIDSSLEYAMDFDLLCRMLAAGSHVRVLDRPLARFRLHAASKSVTHATRMALETSTVARRYWDLVPGLDRAAHQRSVARAALSGGRRALGEGRVLEAASCVGFACFAALRAGREALRRRAGTTGLPGGGRRGPEGAER